MQVDFLLPKGQGPLLIIKGDFLQPNTRE